MLIRDDYSSTGLIIYSVWRQWGLCESWSCGLGLIGLGRKEERGGSLIFTSVLQTCSNIIMCVRVA